MSIPSLQARLSRLEAWRAPGVAVVMLNPERPGFAEGEKRLVQLQAAGRDVVVIRWICGPNRWSMLPSATVGGS